MLDLSSLLFVETGKVLRIGARERVKAVQCVIQLTTDAGLRARPCQPTTTCHAEQAYAVCYGYGHHDNTNCQGTQK